MQPSRWSGAIPAMRHHLSPPTRCMIQRAASLTTTANRLSDATGIGRGNPALNFLRVSPTVMGLNRGDGDRSGESRLFCSNLGGQITAFWIQRR